MKILDTIGAGAILLAMIAVLLPIPSTAAVMADYCQAPPLKSEVSPNIMLTIDVSGSMGWGAYSYGDSDGNGDGILDNYDPTSQYEGYFDPMKYYVTDAGGIYQETVPTGLPCVKTTCKTWACRSSNTGGCDPKGTHGCSTSRFACCTAWNTTGDCGTTTGNYLNYKLMARIDVVRWAMTGGKPATCTGASAFNGSNCEPEAWADSGNAAKVGSVCNNSLDVDGDGTAEGGCILLLDNGNKVKVPWERITGTNLVTGATSTSFGLVFAFAKMPVVPRMGAMFFEGSGVRADKVYLGDFTGANSLTSYKFYNMITMLNSHDPGGMTPTGPAMWDTFNYFAMKPPQYGGFPEQSGSGDRWKNPMYNCANGGTNCTFLPCTDQFVILLSDGSWNQPSCDIGTAGATSADPVVPAYQMHMGFTNVASNVKTKVRSLYTIGLFLGGTGEQSLKNVAMYGAFDNSSKTWPGNLTGYPMSTCNMDDCGSGKGSGCTPLPPSSLDWDSDGTGVPDTFFSGKNATGIKDSLMAAVLDILTHTSAGTAASVLASREGSGANLLQAVYYPKKSFANGTVDWAGNLQNLWYYIDPAFANSTIREDGRDASGIHDNVMNLKTGGTQNDYITQFYFDSGLQSAMANRWTDNNGDASITGETKLAPIKVDNVSNIWEAGQLLWSRSWITRNIYTTDVAGTSPTNNLILFTCANFSNCPNAPVLKPYLNALDSAGVLNDDVASTIMQWVAGADYPWSGTYTPSYRKRWATIGSQSYVWKLGDIINSTPKISTWQPLGDYNITYAKYESTYGPSGSNVYQSDPVNAKYYTTTYRYKGRGMVYAGGNDGMLHAFRLGLLQSKWSGQGTYQKAKLTNNVCSMNPNIFCVPGLAQCPVGDWCSSTATLGEEVWAFIPKSVLPYLKYLADPNYCHIYTVDLTPTVFDASIGYPSVCIQTDYYDCYKYVDSWRTVLIGGMRLGGASRGPSSTCTNCIKAPMVDPDNPLKGFGFSSYFALDITDQNNPKLMWEYDGMIKDAAGNYSNKLSLSYSGPAVVRVSNTAKWGTSIAGQKNGRWFAVFGSGPTGPIDTVQKSFMGLSEQNLMLHIFDLATGPGKDNTNVTLVDTGITNGFSGSITTTTFDIDLDYSDDVLYAPYVSGSTGLNGGIGRLLTNGSIFPSQWTWNSLITDIGPLTAAPDMLIDPDTKDLWVYFGAGRYFYDNVSNTDDADPANRRQLIGMKETCLNATKTGFLLPCSAAVSFCGTPVSSATCGGLTNVDNIAVANNLEATKASSKDPNYKGWYINLDPALPIGSPTFWGERMITNPSVDATGIVYFTSFKPQNDPCFKGGQTNIWAVKYDTGGSATGLIKGTAIIQVSTGSIEQVDLSTAFTQRDNRRTAGMTGQPPTREGLTVIPGAPGVSKPLFMKER